MEKQLKEQIIKCSGAVKRKVKQLRDMKDNNEKFFETALKPITDPLNQMVSKNSHVDQSSVVATPKSSVKRRKFNKKFIEFNNSLRRNDTDVKDQNEYETDDQNEDNTFIARKSLTNTEVNAASSESEHDYEDLVQSSDASFKTLDSSPLKPASASDPSWSLSSEAFIDVPFGARLERGKLFVGSSRLTVTDNNLIIGGHTYAKTVGLGQLLFKKVPDLKLLTEEDKQNYKLILLDTNVHRRDYDPTKPIKSNKGTKYLYVIKPFFRLSKSKSTTGTSNESLSQGSGLPVMKRVKKDIDYVYWDDPNELVDRLRILLASRDAGNTGLDNEIISIIEELRESNIIN